MGRWDTRLATVFRGPRPLCLREAQKLDSPGDTIRFPPPRGGGSPLPFGFGRKGDSNRFEGEDEGEETGKPVNRTNRINYICPNCGMNAWGR